MLNNLLFLNVLLFPLSLHLTLSFSLALASFSLYCNVLWRNSFLCSVVFLVLHSTFCFPSGPYSVIIRKAKEAWSTHFYYLLLLLLPPILWNVNICCVEAYDNMRSWLFVIIETDCSQIRHFARLCWCCCCCCHPSIWLRSHRIDICCCRLFIVLIQRLFLLLCPSEALFLFRFADVFCCCCCWIDDYCHAFTKMHIQFNGHAIDTNETILGKDIPITIMCFFF